MSAADRNECLTREQILQVLEGGGEPGEREHIEHCPQCREFHDSIKSEVDALEISISLVWEEERISCPHRDVLRAHASGSLPETMSDYVRFHLEELACTYCLANLEDLKTLDSSDEERYLRSVRDRVFTSTCSFLKGKDGRRR